MMSNEICLRIADITCTIKSSDPTLRFLIDGSIRNFLVCQMNSDIDIEARWDDLSGIQFDAPRVFDSGALWQVYQTNGFYLFSFSSPVFGPIPYKVAQFQKDFSKGVVLLHRPYFHTDQSLYPLGFPLDELLFTNFLALGRGVEIHACGVVDSYGRGHLFVGQSGAGKTTMAKLWKDKQNTTVLSDDRIILRKIKNAIWMYGTPWHGEAMLASATQVPLTTIYFLEKGRKNELIVQKPVDSITKLFACNFLPFYNPGALSFTLGFLEDVVKNVPCYELRFKPHKSAVELITGKQQ